MSGGVTGSTPIQVLLFSPHPALGGGVVEFNRLMLRHLDGRFAIRHFLVGRRPGKLGKLLRPFVPVYDALRLMILLARSRHDVYHLNPSLVPRSVLRDTLFLLVLRLFRRRSVLVFFRGWDPATFEAITATNRRRRFAAWLLRGVDKSLVLGKSFRKDLVGLGVDPRRIDVLTTMFDGELLAAANRNRSDPSVRILFLARFERTKGMYELLEAFEQVRRLEPRAALILAGDGPEMASVVAWCERRGLRDHVRFTGYVSGVEKAQMLADADLFVLPTFHNEGCPNALLEAMGSGLPVVTTPVGGIRDIVTDGLNALVVPPRDVGALRDAILRLIADPKLGAEMGVHNRRQACDHYEARAVTSLIAGHYVKLAARDAAA